MRQYRHGVHWLSFVVDGPKPDAFMLYEVFFKDAFGDLQCLGNGGRGFKEIYYALLGLKVYVNPSRGVKEYFHFEIPGQACEVMPWGMFQGLDDFIRHNYPGRYHYSRLDYAFDDLPFTPQDVEAAITRGSVKSLAKRKTMAVKQSPFDTKDNGEMGTYTVYFGSRQSERMIRVYDKRGFTRLEMELKQRRADLVAKELFRAADGDEWFPLALSHLLDFVSFEAAWWTEFVKGTGRARAIVSTPKQVSEARMARWLSHQVAPSLSVMHDLHPEDFIREMIATGRTKRGKNAKYRLLLSGERPNPKARNNE